MFMSGIWWRPHKFHSQKWKRIEEQKDQEFLGGDIEGVPPTDVEVTDPEPGKEYLRLRPYQFGKPDGLDDMDFYDSENEEDSSDNDGSDEEEEGEDDK